MLIFLKPVRGGLSLIGDVAGYDNKARYEEEYALHLLTQRRAQRKRKLKKLSFKEKIEARLREGDSPDSIVVELSESILADDTPLTTQGGQNPDLLREQYVKHLRAEIAAAVLAKQEELQAKARAEHQRRIAVELARLAAIQAEEERLAAIERARIEEELRKKKLQNERKVRALLLLASMDDE